MFRRVADFQKVWQQETESTLKVLGALTDASLGQAVTSDDRTLGRLAWHLATTLGEMMERTGLRIGGPAHEVPPPGAATAILAAYEAAARAVATGVASWSDATLEVEDEMYGAKWPRGITLRYEYRPSLVALGVLPRRVPSRDRLWEREHAEPGFAQPPLW